MLLGNSGVASNVDYNTAGVAEAFRTTGSASGQLTTISIYLDSDSNASSLKLGLYTDVNRHPGALLGQGSIASPAAGAWNSATLTPTFAATAGRVYWIAVLAPVGTVEFRDVSNGSGHSEASLQTTLASLPSGWATGKTDSDGPISAFGATDLAADTQPPSVPTALVASSPTQTSVTLGWAASSDNVAVTGYGVYNGTTSNGTTSATSRTLSGLACGTSYNLAVDATDAAGNRSATATISTSTSACPDTTPPSTPTALAVSSATQTSITLAWTASTDNVAVSGYGVYNGAATAGTTSTTGYTVAGLACGTSYNLAVDATDAAANRSAKAPLSASTAACTADTQPPSVPTALVASSPTQTSVTLGWAASSDNVAVTGYGVYNGTTSNGTTSATSRTLSGLACGTSYNLAVDATDAAGNRSATATISTSTSACPDTTPPSTPTALAVSSATQTSITLAWTASTDNVAVSGYGVYKTGVRVASPASAGYTVTGLSCGAAYPLSVDAFDAAGNRSAQASLTGSTSACSLGANLYVATGGNDSTCLRGDSTRPCASFNRAFALAQAGDSVQIADGSYPGQTLSGTATSSPVSFVAQDAGKVLVADLTINVDRVHVTGVISSGTGESRGTLTVCDSGCNATPFVDVVLDGWHGKNAFIRASGVTVQNSEFGNFSPCLAGNAEDGFRFWGGSGANATPTNDSLINSTIHNIDSGSGNTCQGTSHAGYHVDCMQNEGGSNMHITGNVFFNCPTSNMQIAPFGSGNVLNNVFISGNYLGTTQCCNSIVLGLASSSVQCSTLHVTNNVYFQTVNQNGCGHHNRPPPFASRPGTLLSPPVGQS